MKSCLRFFLLTHCFFVTGKSKFCLACTLFDFQTNLQYVVLEMWNPTICCFGDVKPYNMLWWQCETGQYAVLKIWNPTICCVEYVEPYFTLCWKFGTPNICFHSEIIFFNISISKQFLKISKLLFKNAIIFSQLVASFFLLWTWKHLQPLQWWQSSLFSKDLKRE